VVAEGASCFDDAVCFVEAVEGVDVAGDEDLPDDIVGLGAEEAAGVVVIRVLVGGAVDEAVSFAAGEVGVRAYPSMIAAGFSPAATIAISSSIEARVLRHAIPPGAFQ
jgi:hypothetical protein